MLPQLLKGFRIGHLRENLKNWKKAQYLKGKPTMEIHPTVEYRLTKKGQGLEELSINQLQWKKKI
jgi:DNA-binding HxlR family transcriptional regulator